MQIYKSKYKELIFDEKTAICYYTMFSSTASLTDLRHRQEVLKASKALLTKRVKFIVMDFREFKFVNSPDTQNWLIEKIVPIFEKVGVLGIANIMPADFFAGLGIEQLMEDAEQGPLTYDQAYFKSPKMAQDWVINHPQFTQEPLSK